MGDTQWLTLPHAAQYLDLSVDALRRLVRAGKLPEPDRSLGKRMPRWNRAALERAMTGTPSSRNDPDSALEAWLEKQSGHPNRATDTR